MSSGEYRCSVFPLRVNGANFAHDFFTETSSCRNEVNDAWIPALDAERGAECIAPREGSSISIDSSTEPSTDSNKSNKNADSRLGNKEANMAIFMSVDSTSSPSPAVSTILSLSSTAETVPSIRRRLQVRKVSMFRRMRGRLISKFHF